MNSPIATSAVVFIVLVSIARQTCSQAPGPPPAQKAAIAKLAHWVGEWDGTGWAMTRTGERHEFEIREAIQLKLGGIALLVEGVGKAKDPSGSVMHNALAVVSFDPKTQKYRFRHYTLQGTEGESELKPVDGGYEWILNPEGSPATVRFTIKIDGKKWNEVGEVTLDGKTYQRFLEMNLERTSTPGSVLDRRPRERAGLTLLK